MIKHSVKIQVGDKVKLRVLRGYEVDGPDLSQYHLLIATEDYNCV